MTDEQDHVIKTKSAVNSEQKLHSLKAIGGARESYAA